MAPAGEYMYGLAKELFPICRSITGDGVRKTLKILKRELPDLRFHEIESGSKCFDWTVPKEWNIEDAYILDPNGQKIVDFNKSNLHVVGYSVPVDKVLPLEELEKHLHSLPDQPDVIPYVTSYYQERWGFCLPHNVRKNLKPGDYKAVICSKLQDGFLTYGELIVPGETSQEIFLSTYVCHPSMANNELSGPVVQTGLAKWISSQKRRFTYRLVFIPETIGSIVYISRNIDALKKNVIAGFNLSCMGDELCYSYLPTRYGDTISDKVVKHVLKHTDPDYKCYSYKDRGSDERQYCSPGVDLPVASLMRSKYGEYNEYHTSADDLNFISAKGLEGSYTALRRCLEILEMNDTYKIEVLCEPQMGKRGLYPTLSTKDSSLQVSRMMDFLAYCDGTNDVLNIAEIIGAPAWELTSIISQVLKNDLIRTCENQAEAIR